MDSYSDDLSLQTLIQEHTRSNVTVNFVKTLRRLAQNNKDSQENFLKGCQALGKFFNQDKFLIDLHFKLIRNESSSRIHGSTGQTNITGTNHILQPQHTKKKIKLRKPIHYDDDENVDDYNTDLLNSNNSKLDPLSDRKSKPESNNDGKSNGMDNSNQARPKVTLQKISKSKALEHNTYSSVPPSKENILKINEQRWSNELDKSELSQPKSNINTSSSGGISAHHILEGYSSEENDFSSQNEPEFYSDEELLAEDREWYDHDDDYGNPIYANQELNGHFNLPSENTSNNKMVLDSVDENIQIMTTPLNKRKDLLPWFLKNYAIEHNIENAAIIGSLSHSNNDGLIDPYRKPNGLFAVNARKGSYLVSNHRRLHERNEIQKESTNIVGTMLGNILGAEEQNHDDKNRNQRTEDDVTYTNKNDIKRLRESLPVYNVRSPLLQVIRENQVCVIIGETGSGKTTQLAQYLYEEGFCMSGKQIICTQPRRVAAMSVAKRVAQEMGVELGDKVGYVIRFEDKTSRNTQIKFMTDGILLRESLLDKNLDKYSCVIIDEAHERTLNTDVLLGLFKQLLSRRMDIKIIITSATINADKFSEFFGGAPQFKIPGRTYPVELIYSKHPVSDYVEAAVSTAMQIHMSSPVNSGDILIFMTGQEDIETTASEIRSKLLEVYSKKYQITRHDEINDVEVFPIYSALPADIQSKIFINFEGKKRKIIIATNIAETSLTIDGIRYVIDTGYSKLKVYNPRIGLDSLVVTPIAVANANQRSGRAGRTAAGTAYRLYTEGTLAEDMYIQPVPEIQRTNLSNITLLLKSLEINDILKFPFLDKPPTQSFISSLYELWFIGALSNKGELTTLGKAMTKFPLQPTLAKILLLSSKNGCSEEMLTIVSMLSIPQVFYRPKERETESDKARMRFFINESDHLTLLNVYSQWKANKFSKIWCTRNFLQYKSLKRVHEIRAQLKQLMDINKIPVVSSGKDWDIIRKTICSGFSHQSAKLVGLGKYIQLRTGMEVKLHPTSSLYGLGNLPKYVVYNELLMTGNQYICCVTTVDPFWLMDYGSLLFDIKRVKEINDQYSANIFHSYGYDDSSDDKKEIDLIEKKLQKLIKRRKK
ncbi:hypothetical protein TBLA_0I01610 [Henningerozyma blattae CBS 6284]|uniref:Pre-mRNA-splicing factor ATP-dependent RNA helicase PRP16 n=1 Tax=Henningerozyma blattae (strain ATCC 34711 / CBS 6284 / DSM 70876 / NBRC 10599 / NRRL Y-10934 / UCD 77-7) TaxID=1071380 RepID=I2H8W7_HENB6|nr:hypothetical protein TBLA_0I01610 [Tetrapisispora blattae CBS 6284]CCH62819.1 hypothetical protein TBLA_0I01610 [Tetrapisispora blattae CBS 6284]